MQLAGNPWPIGAITQLLTEARGNYKLAKYTHYTGALDCVMLMEPGQENSSLWLHFSASTLPQSPSCSSYRSGQQLRQRNCVCKSTIIFNQTTGIRVFSAPHPAPTP